MRNAGILGVFSQTNFFKKVSFIFFLITPLLISFPLALAVQNSSETDLPNTLNNFDDAFEALRNERDALKEEVAGLKAEKNAEAENVKIRIGDMETEKHKSDEALGAAENKILHLETENQDLRGKIDDLQAQLDRFNDSALGRDSKTADLKDENEGLKTNLSQGERALARASQRIQEMQSAKENLQKELDLLREERKKSLLGHEDELTGFKKNNEKIAAQLKSAETELKMLQEKFVQSNLRIVLLQKEADKASGEADKILKEKYVQLQKKYDILLREKKREAAQAADTVRALTNKMKSLKNEQQKESEQYNSHLQALENRITQLTNKITSYSQAFGLCTDELVKVKKEKDELAKPKEVLAKPVVRLR